MAAKILLVEDDNNLREIYEARLQAEGYVIATARDGEEALVVAKAQKPDLIISDVMMPRISGFEMLDILRNTEELKYTKVIMLTALGQADDKTRASSLGADRYLVKSQVTLEDIVKNAHELLDTPSTAPPDPIAPIPAETSAPATTPVAVSGPAPAAEVPATPAAVPTATEGATPAAPVVPSSAPEPAPPLEPAAAAPVTTPTEPVPSTPTAAEETAVMDKQIQNFIDKPAPATEVTSPTDKSQDDNTLASAASDLSANSPLPATEPDTTNNTQPAEVSPTAPGVEPPTPVSEATPTFSNPSDAVKEALANNNGVTIANKKIIQPLQSEAKPNINELAAAEEAKNIAQAGYSTAEAIVSSDSSTPDSGGGAAPPIAVDGDKPSGSATPSPLATDNASSSAAAPPTSTGPDKPAGFDPNNIAL